MQEKELNSGFSTEVKRSRFFSSNVNDHCHVNAFKLTGVGSQPSMVL